MARTAGERWRGVKGGCLRDFSGLGSGRHVPQKLAELGERSEVARVEVFRQIQANANQQNASSRIY